MYVRRMINFFCDAGSFLLFTVTEVMRIWAYLGAWISKHNRAWQRSQ